MLETVRKRIIIPILAVLIVVATLLALGYHRYGWMFYKYESAACKAQGKAYGERIQKLKRDARDRLGAGAKREEVIRVFQENGLPVSFDKVNNEYEGTITIKGCSPAGCGTDNGILSILVKVDSSGKVVAEPVVSDLYIDCL
jgi:hypothetical protein